jgi:hypothetical protein
LVPLHSARWRCPQLSPPCGCYGGSCCRCSSWVS